MVRTVLSLLMLALACCSALPGPKPVDPDSARVESPEPLPAHASLGGIYRPNYGMAMFADARARQAGGVLTVQLSERTVSSKSAGSDVSKDRDRKSTRLNSSHVAISYDVFCFKTKGTSNDMGA